MEHKKKEDMTSLWGVRAGLSVMTEAKERREAAEIGQRETAEAICEKKAERAAIQKIHTDPDAAYEETLTVQKERVAKLEKKVEEIRMQTKELNKRKDDGVIFREHISTIVVIPFAIIILFYIIYDMLSMQGVVYKDPAVIWRSYIPHGMETALTMFFMITPIILLLIHGQIVKQLPKKYAGTDTDIGRSLRYREIVTKTNLAYSEAEKELRKAQVKRNRMASDKDRTVSDMKQNAVAIEETLEKEIAALEKERESAAAVLKAAEAELRTVYGVMQERFSAILPEGDWGKVDAVLKENGIPAVELLRSGLGVWKASAEEACAVFDRAAGAKDGAAYAKLLEKNGLSSREMAEIAQAAEEVRA